jgi:uncharacterized protein with ATP-grasp and redox domains
VDDNPTPIDFDVCFNIYSCARLSMLIPSPIRTDGSNAFAHRTMRTRFPALLREIQSMNPDYKPPITRALESLAVSMENDKPIPMIDLPAHDYDAWLPQCAPHAGETWQNAEWFFGEVYFFRLVMQAVRWFETNRDPFMPKKVAELENDELWAFLNKAQSIQGDTPTEHVAGLLPFALWGNRIDLSYALAASHGREWADEDLLVDDTSQAVDQLVNGTGTVHLIADNTGTELAGDLVFIDGLLNGIVDTVVLHVKFHPTYVSDATVPDVFALLDVLISGERGRVAHDLGVRLYTAFSDGRLRIASDPYWNSTRFIRDLPPHLGRTFQGARLVISKGDANYRRFVDDTIHEPTTPASEIADYFPYPLLLLRTLKSDPVIGLVKGVAEKLDGVETDWRINGRRGLLQVSMPE